MSYVVNPFVFAVVGGGSTTLDYRTKVEDTANATTYTYTSTDIGAADASRVVVCGIGWGNGVGANRSVSTVTIGGISATIGAQVGITSEGGTAVAYATVPTGTTATIVVTMTGGATRNIVAVYRVIPVISTTALDAVASTGGIDAQDVQIAVNGALICASYDGGDPSAMTIVYNGVDTPVSNVSGALESDGAYIFWSCLTTENATTRDAGSSRGRSVAVSFR